ncbi:hypothetical protein [Halobiforma nitratireducens]|nr:hypothetical protein [Halobiforma nitratireducens]
MSKEEVEDSARRAGLTPREYCLREISQWKDMLHEVSDDYCGLDDDEFDELVEREIDSWRQEKENEG